MSTTVNKVVKKKKKNYKTNPKCHTFSFTSQKKLSQEHVFKKHRHSRKTLHRLHNPLLKTVFENLFKISHRCPRINLVSYLTKVLGVFP